MHNKGPQIISITLIASLLISFFTLLVFGLNPPSTSAKSSVLYYPKNNQYIYEKNADARLPMASVTKIMTALIAVEECSLDEIITIPAEATNIEGSSLYLKENDRISIGDLIHGVLLQSANDAATALAIYMSGDIKLFSDKMNCKAAKIGMTNTSFENPHGLDSENHYTTARDMSILAAEAIKNDIFVSICSKIKDTALVNDSIRVLINHNKLLKKQKGVFGIKTGYTKKSGRCLVSAFQLDGEIMICVTLNAPDDWNDHINLYKYGMKFIGNEI